MSEIRTPPSLKWLIDKRARLLGEIERLQQEISSKREENKKEIARAERKLSRLRALEVHQPEETLLAARRRDLAAINAAMQLHQIQIDPDLINPVRSQTGQRLLKYGQTTRLIYSCLKDAYPNSADTTEIATYMCAVAGLELDDEMFSIFRQNVRYRLKALASEGKIVPLHNRRLNLEGRWRLLSPRLLPDQIGALQPDDNPASNPATSETNHC